MVDIYPYLESVLPLRFSSEPYDLYDKFVAEWESRRTGSIMPPSPAVTAYAMDYVRGDEGVEYNVQVQWHPAARKVFSQLPDWQQTHRSRVVALAYSEGRIEELNKRVNRIRDWGPDKIRATGLSDRESHETFSIVMEKWKDYTKLNPIHFRKYAEEHKRSSLGQGHRAREMLMLSDSELKHIFELVRRNIEMIEENEGRYAQLDYHTGIRARADGASKLTNFYSGLMQISRIIEFHPSVSMASGFNDNKPDWYGSTLGGVRDALNCEPEYIWPFTRGGLVYSDLAALFANGLPFDAFDGKSWDSVIGMLLGPSFRPFWTYIKGIPMLGSGVTLTSMLDTIGSMVATRHWKGTIVNLGDDDNGFGLRIPKHVPWVERQPGDSQRKWALGMTYAIDPMVPRFCGVKVSSDRGDLMRPLPMSRDFQSILMAKARDASQIAAYLGCYMGQFGEGTLLDSVTGIKASDFKAGFTEYIEEKVELGSVKDPFRWAKELGITNVWA